MYLVLLETSGNQNFIFSTNKLRENIGASQLTYLSGTQWVLDAVERVTQTRWTLLESDEKLREKLLDNNFNRAIETDSNIKVEVIIATSGKALLITQDELTARSIIQSVTTKALEEAPGLDICGVFEPFEWNQENSLATTIEKIYKTHQIVHAKHPSPELRFLRLPIIDECQTSGLPAAYVQSVNQKKIVLSNVSKNKHDFYSQGDQRIQELLRRAKPNLKLASSWRNLEAEFTDENSLDWLAVVHADGNGLGQIFLNFEKCLDNLSNNREYVDKLRKFSIALDICTENAFLSAIDVFETEKGELLPVIPLILGGDDLTIICAGKLALNFTHQFLSAFEKETAKNDIVTKIAQKGLKARRLSACAGISIIKPHFPFSIAYELAEALSKQAKIVKKKIDVPCSTLDFHILYDSSGINLDEIRERLTVDKGKTKLYQKPYVITELDKLKTATGQDWIKLHHWDNFKKRVDILLGKDQDDKERLNIPSSQVNYLRSLASSGRESVNNQHNLIYQRYPAFEELVEDKVTNSLFAKEPETNDIYGTGLFDALEAIDFLKKEEANHESQS